MLSEFVVKHRQAGTNSGNKCGFDFILMRASDACMILIQTHMFNSLDEYTLFTLRGIMPGMDVTGVMQQREEVSVTGGKTANLKVTSLRIP